MRHGRPHTRITRAGNDLGLGGWAEPAERIPGYRRNLSSRGTKEAASWNKKPCPAPG